MTLTRWRSEGMRRGALILTAAIAVAVVVAATHGTPVEPPPTAEELDALVGTEWYSVRIFGQPSGYACIETQRVDGADGPVLRVTEDMKVLIRLAGRELQAGKSQVTLYDEQLRPVSVELDKDEMGRRSRISARLDDGRLVVRTASPGADGADAHVQRLDVPDDLASDLLIPVALLRDELQVGDDLDYSVYDPEVNVIDRHVVMVGRREALDGVQTLVVTAHSEQLDVDVVSWINEDGVLLQQSVPGMMDLKLVRVSEEEALESLAPFEVDNLVQVRRHLPLVRSVKQVRMRVRRTVGPAAELIPRTHRQTVEEDGDEALVTIQREQPPERQLTLPITDEAVAAYVQPTAQAQSDDPAIVQTAQEIVGEETDAWGAAQKLCSWVHREMQKVDSEPRPITALECLEEMRGDCTEHAMLMAALGRAVGLPTRLATGLAYVRDSFGYHAWTEVWVGRWVEMDPAWGEMTADAGHLQLHASSLEKASYARASLATARTIGAIGIDLLGYTAADGREVNFEQQ